MVSWMLLLTWAAAAPQPATVVVVVDNLRSPAGSVLCALYSQPAGFPDHRGDSAPAYAQRVPVGSRPACIFGSLAAGTYALAVVHDENDNGRMDTNLWGMPKEGWGVSGGRAHPRRRPLFADCAFAVAAGARQVLRLKLHYP